MNMTHLRFEILRTFRARPFLIIALALPLVLYVAIVPGNRHQVVEGDVKFPLYFMTGMAAYGALFAVFSPMGRLAVDRSRGWIRQNRVTPLRPVTYIGAKALAAFAVALPALVLLFAVGSAFGVRLSASQWGTMIGLLLVGLIPFVVMGIAIGHVIRPEAIQAVVGGLVVVFSLFGGVFGQLFSSGVMLKICKGLPSYWLVQAGHQVTGSPAWSAEGWIVVAVWTVVMLALASIAYRRDVRRV